MSTKKSVDLRSIVAREITKLSKEQFLSLINTQNGTLSVDGKPLSEEELKAATALVRLMRG